MLIFANPNEYQRVQTSINEFKQIFKNYCDNFEKGHLWTVLRTESSKQNYWLQ
jgi:hypothetical protein